MSTYTGVTNFQKTVRFLAHTGEKSSVKLGELKTVGGKFPSKRYLD